MEKAKAFLKILKTIESVKLIDQYASCYDMINNFSILFKDPELVEYLMHAIVKDKIYKKFNN